MIHPWASDMLFPYLKVSRVHVTLGRKRPIDAPRYSWGGAAAYPLGSFTRRVPAPMVLPGVRPALSATGQRLRSPLGTDPWHVPKSAEHSAPTGYHSATQRGALVPAEEFRHRGSDRHTKHCQASASLLQGFLKWGWTTVCGWRSGQ